MQLKSARGVQQEDVWTAADQLVGEGLRPTIERVRLKIGRGSPNTVSPMLDAWFSTLGARLGVGSDAQASGSELPLAVRQLAGNLWETALLEAKTHADLQLSNAHHTLDAERASIVQHEMELAQRQQNLLERQRTLDELLMVARGQVEDLSERLAQAGIQVNRREAEIDRLQLKLTHLETQRVADQRGAHEQLRHHAEERRKLEEHASITERRLITELDRERQETKRLKSNLEKSELRLETSGTQFQAQLQTLTQKQMDAELALRTERQASLAVNQRANELRDLLDEQVKESTAIVEQLRLLMLTAASAKVPNAEKFGRRVKVKAIQPRHPQ